MTEWLQQEHEATGPALPGPPSERGERRPEVHAWHLRAGGFSPISRAEAATLVRNGRGPSEGIVWIDLVAPREEEAQWLRDELRLHAVAVDDVMGGRQRPKLERYPRHLFAVFYAAHHNRERRRTAFHELHLFIGSNFLVTAAKGRIEEIREVVTHCRSRPGRFRSVGGIVHALLDAIVDDYFPIIHDFSEKVSRLETQTLELRPEAAMEDIVALRRELILFRRVIAPERDAIGVSLRRDIVTAEPELMPYFQDLRDHLERLTEEIDTLRELMSTVVEARVTTLSNQLNQTIRIMTSWSIILMSMAVVTGVYGMNFARMPELDWRYGYGFAIGLMFAVGGSLFVYFRRRGWL